MPPPFVEQSDSSSSDGDDRHDEGPVPSFDSIEAHKRFSLNVHGTYTKWGPREAFRELIQNWRDAIIESNKLAPKDLCVKREAKGEANGEASPPAGDTEIVYKAFHREAKDGAECLGFVRYKGRNGVGTIEITNLRAALQTKHLCFGRTSKEDREDQAGAHGEGLKLAALALMRGDQNHRVFGRSSGFNLSFNFDNEGCLYVDANRIKTLSSRQPKNVAFPTPAVSAKHDVQFIIGERRQGRNEHGFKVKRSPVHQKDFKSWGKVALFLTQVEGGNASIVSTYGGDLLTSAELHGKLYLKGLLLSESTQSQSASITGLPLGFGYNFAFGKTDRERHSLADADEESTAICRILTEAINLKPDLAGKVCDLLNSAEPQYAEGACCAQSWPQSVALLFKQHLLGGEFASRWLYCSDEVQKSPSLLQIIKGMGKQPFNLTDKLWGILAYHSLVHTSEKEAQRSFKNAPKFIVAEGSFPMSVNRLLWACILACPQTATMKVEFVDAGQTHLHLHVLTKKDLIRIHKRWLDLPTAVTELGLVGDMAEAETVTYTVKRLFADILSYLPREVFLHQDGARLPDSYMKQECHRAEQRLVKCQKLEMRIAEGPDGCSLKVEWAVNAQQQDHDLQIEIQCHRVSYCSRPRENFLIAADAEAYKLGCTRQDPVPYFQGPRRRRTVRSTPNERPLASCRVRRTKFSQGSHCEYGLKSGEAYYFVLLTPGDPKSFIGLSETRCAVERPYTVSPRAASVATSQSFTNTPERSFSLGPKLETQQFLELAMASDRWYKAENSQNVQAVIGFVKGEELHQEESRKRRRID